MNAQQFVEVATRRGYCTEGVAKLYTELYTKDEYEREDFLEAYRLQSRQAKTRDSSWAHIGNGNYKKKKHIYGDSL